MNDDDDSSRDQEEDVQSQLTEEDNLYIGNSNEGKKRPISSFDESEAMGSIRKELGRMTNREYVLQKCKLIKHFAQDKAFFVKQFARNDKNIEIGSEIQKKACEEAGLKDELAAKQIWKMGGMKSFKSGLAMKRKITMCAIQNAVKSMKIKGEELPKMTALEVQMRAGSEYIIFCKFIISKAFGVCRWKCLASQKPFREFISPSFEAFVLLCYENIYDWASSDNDNRATLAKWKYTSTSRSGRANGGWKEEAFVRLGTLYAKVKKDREDHKEFDQKLMDELEFLDKENKRQKKNMNIEVDDPEDDFADYNMFTAV